MPSVGSTPTTSPATSTVNSSQNDQQSNNNINIYTQCNHHYHNHTTLAVFSTTGVLSGTTALNDVSNNSSSTTTSSISTPIHSPELQSSSLVCFDNNSQTALNRYSLNAQIATIPTKASTVSALVTSPKNILSSTLCANQFNYNSTPNRNPFYGSNNLYHQLPHTESTKFMVITPAVSIDRDFDNNTGAPSSEECNETFNYSGIKTATNFTFSSINNNILDMTNINNSNYYHEPYSQNHQQQQDRQNYLSNNFRFKYNSIYNQQQQQEQQKTNANFLSKSANTFSGFTAANTPSSWRWCSLICAAMRCFGGGRNNTGASNYTSTFSTRNYTQVKDDSASFGSGNKLSSHFNCVSGISGNSNNSGIKLNRNLKTSHQNNSTKTIAGPFATPRKTRDHMNNICYEL